MSASFDEEMARKRKAVEESETAWKHAKHELHEVKRKATKAKREAELAKYPSLIVGSTFTGEATDACWTEINGGKAKWLAFLDPVRIDHAKWNWCRVADGTRVLCETQCDRYNDISYMHYRNIKVESSEPLHIGLESDAEESSDEEDDA